jgi:hypothetical protein
MSTSWSRREFWMELAGDKPGMIGELNHLD